MARVIELDWVVIRIITVGKVVAVGITAALAAGLLILVHYQMNPTPDVAARRAIRKAERAQHHAQNSNLPESWSSEVVQATEQLDDARTAYGEESFKTALEMAESAQIRFAALAGAGAQSSVGSGQFFSIDGRVTVEHSGQSDWQIAKPKMPVFNGDFVKTGRNGSAEILFTDGTLFLVAPNSLLEIHHNHRTSSDSGTVKMVVGKINISTGRSASVVATNSAETHIERDSRIAVAVGATDEGADTVVSSFSGRAVVRNESGHEVRLSTRQQVAMTEEGQFTKPRTLPKAPVPIAPANSAAFDIRHNPVIQLQWANSPGSQGVKLQVSQTKNFPVSELDVDSPVISASGARLQTLHPGIYFWRLASIQNGEIISEWSPVRRFRIHSPEHRQVIRDLEPPHLSVAPIRQLGHLFIVEGSTEIGATITINGAKVETDNQGRFRRAVEVHNMGWNEIIIRSTDPAGNQIDRRERVFLEDF